MAEPPVMDQGAWKDDEKKVKAAPLTGRGADTDVPDALRFLVDVRRMVLAREREPDAEFDRSAAMVLVPAQFYESAPPGLVRRLLSSGNYPLTGQVHYLGVAATGKSREYDGDDGALVDALEADHVQSLPTVIYLPKAGGHSKLHWYPQGVAHTALLKVYAVNTETPTPDLIQEVINSVYEGDLKTPDNTPKGFGPWENSAKGYAAENAEERVQRAVKLGLHGRFGTHCRITAEQPDKDGRTDIEIVGDFGVEHGKQTNFAVLEMKVLRERGSTGILEAPSKNEAAIVKGLGQASTYGDDRHFLERMLCCFDMRATNAGAAAVFAPIKDKAAELKVHLYLWYLYRSSDHYRDAQVAAKVTGG